MNHLLNYFLKLENKQIKTSDVPDPQNKDATGFTSFFEINILPDPDIFLKIGFGRNRIYIF